MQIFKDQQWPIESLTAVHIHHLVSLFSLNSLFLNFIPSLKYGYTVFSMQDRSFDFHTLCALYAVTGNPFHLVFSFHTLFVPQAPHS